MLQRQHSESVLAFKPADALGPIGYDGDPLPLTASASPTPLLRETMVADRDSATVGAPDSAVTAVVVIGLWLLLVGLALLARRQRLARLTTISEAAWQRQLRTAARQTPA